MICAVTMVKDEADVIGHTIGHLLAEGVDQVIVADNLSTDATPDILDSFDDRVLVVDDNDPGFTQDRKMTELARMAAKLGAEWVLPFDADEVWYSPHGSLVDTLNGCELDVVLASGWDHVATDDDDPTEPNPLRRIRHRRVRPQRLPKVAFRWHPDIWIDHGNHDVFNHPGQRGRALGYRHFQFRSYEQMCSKVRNGKAAYEHTDLHPTYGAHWREMGALDDEALWHRWRRLCEEPGLVDDPAPVR